MPKIADTVSSLPANTNATLPGPSPLTLDIVPAFMLPAPGAIDRSSR